MATTFSRLWLSATALTVLFAAAWLPSMQPLRGHAGDTGHTPALAHTCLITSNVKRLVGFYEPILGLRAKWSGDDYAEFATGGEVLAIFSAAAQENYISGSAASSANRSAILEFNVADVDYEYRRLQALVKTWVKPPTTQPWGTRSIYFRDPDGNLVDFFASAKTQR